MQKVARLAIHGAVAGGLAAACLTVFRMIAHRAGGSGHAAAPAPELWESAHADLALPAATAGQPVLEQLIYIGCCSAWGGFYALVGRRGPVNAARALEVGLPLWAFGSTVPFPARDSERPAWRSAPPDVLFNLMAHLLYGAITVFVTEELERQDTTRARVNPRSLPAPVIDAAPALEALG